MFIGYTPAWLISLVKIEPKNHKNQARINVGLAQKDIFPEIYYMQLYPGGLFPLL